MKIHEILSEAPRVHSIQQTFTPRVHHPEVNANSPDYDWRNPNHNPSGAKPKKDAGHKVKGKYVKSNYPVIDTEHGTHLFDPALVDELKIDIKDWNEISELEQIKCQLDFIQPPSSKFDNTKYEANLEKRALKLQTEIKR
jgi:hypothetical protein